VYIKDFELKLVEELIYDPLSCFLSDSYRKEVGGSEFKKFQIEYFIPRGN